MSTVRLEKDGAVGVVSMAKPPHNLIDDELLTGLRTSFASAVEQGCRSILLKSDMRHFCAGADVAAFKSGLRAADQSGMVELWAALEDVPIPTVAAVHGAALGGGFEFALMCDIILAADTASIGMPEVSLGLLPLLGGVQRVIQRAGPARGKEMAMLGRRHDPRTLERWGVINLVVPEQELQQVALSWARQLGSGATVALRGIKMLSNISARSGIKAADQHQAAANDMMWASSDSRRGLEAFVSTGPGSAVFEGK